MKHFEHLQHWREAQTIEMQLFLEIHSFQRYILISQDSSIVRRMCGKK
ncbi:MAG: hypothetical protein Q9N32_08790 [Gammaproteobacteria bacterium]|nr:hypothetical protein [Gammaproteobacteria bacterium]